MRLGEAVAEAQHSRRALAPARDDILAIGALEIEMPEYAELVRVAAHRFDGVGIHGIPERARRMDHRAIDPGRFHLRQRLVVRIRGVLAMMGAHLSVLPDVDLRIDYQHWLLLKNASAVRRQRSAGSNYELRLTNYGHGYITQPTRSVCALKKWPFVLVTNIVVMSGPPKQTLVGRLAGTGCVSSTRPEGENT